MARVKILLPDEYLFQTSIPVRITDINYGGHLGNDRLLSLIHEARVKFINHLGFEGEDRIDGSSIIMSDVSISYKSEVFYGHELNFEIGVKDVNKHGCDIVYRITKSSDDRITALAKTGIVFYDYQAKKIAYMPAVFRQKISG